MINFVADECERIKAEMQRDSRISERELYLLTLCEEMVRLAREKDQDD